MPPLDDALPHLLSRSSVVLFGDSLTQRGFEPGGWAAALAHYFGRRADVYNRGYGGYNARWAAELAPRLFEPAASRHLLVTIWLGANDAADATERAHVPLHEFERSVAAIAAAARRAARVVVVLTPPPVRASKATLFLEGHRGDLHGRLTGAWPHAPRVPKAPLRRQGNGPPRAHD